MALLSYWTIPYVSLEDSRLVWAYNAAFMAVIGSLLGNIFIHMSYLQSDVLHGLAQARLKTPASWSPLKFRGQKVMNLLNFIGEIIN